MRKILMLLVLLIGLLQTAIPVHAQERTISGVVSSGVDQAPLGGVTVRVKGTTRNAVTNATGQFTISAAKGQVLQVSYVGFQPLDFTVGDDDNIGLVLQQQQGQLGEVVVVGYGTQKKANLTGAVSTVDVSKTMESRPINDPTKALQGVVPGLTITYGNGGLTAGASINIRGVGSPNGSGRPLILVDNVETSDLSVINPNDIESISVLKDAASTSIYGARAAFGVVLVKTKSGKRNQKATVTYSNNFAWSKPTVLPDFSDPELELDALHGASQRSGITTPEIFGMQLTRLREGIANWKRNYAGKRSGSEMIEGEDFKMESDGRMYFYRVWDPKEEMLKDYTQQQQHNIRLQGGGDKVGYYLSFNYANDGGILKLNPDNLKKYNITASINSTVNKWLDVDARMLYRNFNYESPFGYQDYWYYFWRWGSYFPYGTWKGNYFRHTPAYLAEANTNSVTDNYQRVDLGATIKLHKNLNIRADYTIGRSNTIRHEAGGPVYAWDFWSPGDPRLNNIATAAQDRVAYNSGRYAVNTLNAYATYNKSFKGDHNLKLMSGVNWEENEGLNFNAQRLNPLDPNKPELNLATGEQTTTSGHSMAAYAGYFGRVNYNFKGKYLLELNGRYDGSSLFSRLDRWALFTSASAGYRISEENFMQFLKPVVSDWKLRVSYGTVGNQDVGGSNVFLPLMTGSAVPWVIGNTRVQGISAPRSVASSLTWEKVRTLDFGTDLRLFKNKVGVTFDWYERNTEGIQAPVAVPATFGTTGPRINSGTLRNRGWEVAVDINHEVNRDLNLYGIFTLADNKAVYTKWDNPSMLIMQNYQGKTYGEIWGFETDRYFESADDVTKSPSQTILQSGNFVFGPGDVKYKDLNGDNVINGGKMSLSDPGDLKVIGNNQPRYQYGIRLGGTFKGIDADIFIQGVGKRDYWGLGNVSVPLYQGADILYAHQLDFWTAENTNAQYPRPYIGNNATRLAGMPTSGNNYYPQTKYLLNLAYARLKNVTIGYALPTNVLNRFNVQKLRFYVSGQNLAEISNVGLPLDPEITDGELGFLGRTFPFQRMFTFGAQLTF
ncbi:SusC/RagA family TonB-linked outer membrane protein [Pseudocnuella soli]|uniref:SusC/RagA family TonB-linked outer membrane protein n=1 Tax=Pseudocnuella soli TaxID=2502779 RepID=UPI001044D2E2|nr:TonB-dependent receptor [Pseudocnuella soli]